MANKIRTEGLLQSQVYENGNLYSISIADLKGNEINTGIYKKFKKDLSNKLTSFNCYSDEEEVDLEEDEEEEITKKIENIDLNKK